MEISNFKREFERVETELKHEIEQQKEEMGNYQALISKNAKNENLVGKLITEKSSLEQRIEELKEENQNLTHETAEKSDGLKIDFGDQVMKLKQTDLLSEGQLKGKIGNDNMELKNIDAPILSKPVPAVLRTSDTLNVAPVQERLLREQKRYVQTLNSELISCKNELSHKPEPTAIQQQKIENNNQQEETTINKLPVDVQLPLLELDNEHPESTAKSDQFHQFQTDDISRQQGHIAKTTCQETNLEPNSSKRLSTEVSACDLFDPIGFSNQGNQSLPYQVLVSHSTLPRMKPRARSPPAKPLKKPHRYHPNLHEQGRVEPNLSNQIMEPSVTGSVELRRKKNESIRAISMSIEQLFIERDYNCEEGVYGTGITEQSFETGTPRTRTNTADFTVANKFGLFASELTYRPGNIMNTVQLKDLPNPSEHQGAEVICKIKRLHQTGILMGIFEVLTEKNVTEKYAGIKLSIPMGSSDGEFKGVRFFQCDPYHGVFIPFDDVLVRII